MKQEENSIKIAKTTNKKGKRGKTREKTKSSTISAET
jgi:hypothetical protein